MEYQLTTPLSANDVIKLVAGDVVYLNGIIITARDKAHERLLQWSGEGKKIPFELKGATIYHCGPLMRKNTALAAGPTTSARMSKMTTELLKRFEIRVIIGKGGMNITEVLRDKCVYLTYTGGCGSTAAKQIKRVVGNYWTDLGMAESVWVLEVENFGPLIVATDAQDNDLFDEVQKKADQQMKKFK
ncbi:MAG: FumA C-terminus/TtdB family hydratase beta subunit [Methanocellales archaeon]|nr:FumA C-terminus/TtdB family hydratase beta subunit [Methanocellales archaeon]MDD3421791.1 FumA C-terminus/TtdB family hydratase beta subunit [Methanocellales archaeon]MDD4897887.1 FumA C-terminus/TtdB family hydratase beta subunit [Methanocellales archaeon]MDD5446452.1 FumA C-terminus/TtdB family hydratase beta subunit [Methanocellales archaeon]